MPTVTSTQYLCSPRSHNICTHIRIMSLAWLLFLLLLLLRRLGGVFVNIRNDFCGQ
jgi:hypothetical protein